MCWYQLSFDSSNMAQQNPSFKTIQSTPHLNLSAHTFAIYTLPFHRISSILDLLAFDEATTHDLLVLDRIHLLSARKQNYVGFR